MQNESVQNEKHRTNPPRRRSPRRWATYEPEQEMADGVVALSE